MVLPLLPRLVCLSVSICLSVWVAMVAPISVEASGQGSDAPWRRILWAKQPFPDNYTSSQFLQMLQSERESPYSAQLVRVV